MSVIIDGLLFGWDKNKGYGSRLVSDLTEEQMIAQPGEPHPDSTGVNHPAWVLAHLNLYHSGIVKLIHGEPFDDPRDAPYGMLTKPEADRAAYPSKDELVGAWEAGHDDVAAALREGGEAALERDMTLPRWQKVMPKVGIALPYLMLVHENTHLGQLSCWRRVQGLPSV